METHFIFIAKTFAERSAKNKSSPQWESNNIIEVSTLMYPGFNEKTVVHCKYNLNKYTRY